MLHMWKLLPDPVVCAALYAILYTALMYPQLRTLIQDISSHSFVGTSFTSISPSFCSDIRAVAIAVCQGLPTLQAMIAFDEFRPAATNSAIVGCVLDCCFRSWDTLNRLLRLEHEVLMAAVDSCAVHVLKRQKNQSRNAQSRSWDDIASSIDPLLVWSDHYVRTSDCASGGETAQSSCPSPCEYAFMSLPSCHLSTLKSSITFIITLCEDSPALKASVVTNPRLIQCVKSAIHEFAALFNWLDVVRACCAFVLHWCVLHVSR
jgi:hypothetical protein